MSDILTHTKRLSLSEIVTMLLTRHNPPREGIDLERGMRGEYKVAVSGVARDEETLEELAMRLEPVFDRLCARYGKPNGDNLEAQLALIARLCADLGMTFPEVVHSKQEASEIIDRLRAGTYRAEDYYVADPVPF